MTKQSSEVKDVEVIPPAPVAPLESVEETVEAVEKAEEVVVQTPTIEESATDPCWNCKAQLEQGQCAKCGFDKSLLHNLHLESARAAVIQQQVTK